MLGFLPALTSMLVACSPGGAGPSPPLDERLVPLRWVAGYPGDSWERSKAGLWWSLSALGATPPPEEPGLFVVDQADGIVVFDLDLAQIGLPPDALDALWAASADVVASDEVRTYGGADIGRFLMRTLYEPWHYYQIVGACPDFDDWSTAHLDVDTAGFAVNASMIVEGERMVVFAANPSTSADIALVAAEGPGSIAAGTFDAIEHETVDVLANGRQRFSVYDEQGLLQAASTPDLSPAGQPGRCMWCHEDHVMPAAPANVTVEPWLDVASFNEAIAAMQRLIVERRSAVPTAVDFFEHDVHTWGELLGETFLHPSMARVAREWRVSVERVEAMVSAEGLTLAPNEEYPEAGMVLVRSEVDALHDRWADDGTVSLPTLPSARELDPTDEPGGAGLDADTVRATLAPCAP